MLGMGRKAELPSLLAARGASPSKKKTGIDEHEVFGTLDICKTEIDEVSAELGSIINAITIADPVLSWELCKNLDDILDIGGPQLNVIGTVYQQDALSTAEESVISANEEKQIIFNVLDEIIDAYREDAFQAHLVILLEMENKSKKRRARAPVQHLDGREELCKKVISVVLPKYKFVGMEDGLVAFAVAARPYYNDADVQEKLKTIDLLLGLPPNASFLDLRCLVRRHQPHLRADTVF